MLGEEAFGAGHEELCRMKSGCGVEQQLCCGCSFVWLVIECCGFAERA